MANTNVMKVEKKSIEKEKKNGVRLLKKQIEAQEKFKKREQREELIKKQIDKEKRINRKKFIKINTTNKTKQITFPKKIRAYSIDTFIVLPREVSVTICLTAFIEIKTCAITIYKNNF